MLDYVIEFLINIATEMATEVIIGLFLFIISIAGALVSRNNTARQALKESVDMHQKRPYAVFKAFVKPQFNSIQGFSDTKVLQYKDLWKYMMNSNDKQKVIFICGEPGQGKSRLLEYIYFKLLMRGKILRFRRKNVCFARFSHYKNIDELCKTLEDWRPGEPKYVLLDGFDEFSALRYHSPDEIYNQLSVAIRTFGPSFMRLVITTRLEPLSKGELLLQRSSFLMKNADVEIPVKVIKLKNWSNTSIIKIYTNRQRDGDTPSYGNYMINLFSKFKAGLVAPKTMLTELKTMRKLKRHLKITGEGNSLFRNTFFATKADSLLNALERNDITELTLESAFHIIVEKAMDKEFNICQALQLVDEKAKVEDFREMLTAILMKISKLMLPNNGEAVNKDVPSEYLSYIHTRALLVRTNETLRFIHRMFWEYFLACGLQSMEYTNKRELLMGEDKTHLLKFYANRLMYKAPSLRYTIEHLKQAIVNEELDSVSSIIRVLSKTNLRMNPNAPISIRELIETLPLVNKIQFTQYALQNEQIHDYIIDGDLILRGQGLRNLDRLQAFGEINFLDIEHNDIQDLSGLLFMPEIDTLWIPNCAISLLHTVTDMRIVRLITPVHSVSELQQVISQKNVQRHSVYLSGKEPQNTIDLYHEMLSLMDKGITLNIVNVINKNTVSEIIAYLADISSPPTLNFFPNREIKDSLSKSISSLESPVDDDTFNKLHETFSKRIPFHQNPSLKKLSDMISFLETVYLVSIKSRFHHDQMEIQLLIRLTALFYHKRSMIQEHLHEAIHDISQALLLNTSIGVCYWDRGHLLYRTERYEAAISDLTQAILKLPINSSLLRARVYLTRGLALHKTDRYTEALEDFTQAISLNYDIYYYLCRGDALYVLKRYREALEDFSLVIENSGLNPDPYFKRAKTLHEMKRYKDALADFLVAIKIIKMGLHNDPYHYASYYYNKGKTLYMLKQYAEAEQDRQKAIELDPDGDYPPYTTN